jgi:transcriptional regulator with XRE-family HTH domain
MRMGHERGWAMGVRGRRMQKKLARKLKKIRTALRLSQGELIKELRLKELQNSNISMYESGKREPPLYVLLKYAEAANVCLDVIVSDKHNLPGEIPCKKTYSPHIQRTLNRISQKRGG